MWSLGEDEGDEGAVAGSRLLVVDDSATQRFVLVGLLSRHYEVLAAEDGEQALALAQADPQPDLILMDVEMPGVDGFEACRRLKTDERTRHIPVVFLTGMTQPEHESRGLWLGATDYLVKPVNPPLLMARVLNQLQLKRQADRLRQRHRDDLAQAQRELQEARRLHRELLVSVVGLIGGRDRESDVEARRIQQGVRVLAQAVRGQGRIPAAAAVTDGWLDDLFCAAAMHDIGKAAVPDRVLIKPGALTPEELELMKAHTTAGARAIERAQAAWGQPSDLLQIAHEVTLSHHERWDGSGYPQGLAGPQIPLSARLVAIIDAYEDLTSERDCKVAMRHDQAVRLLAQESGRHFDPDVVEAFLEAAPEIEACLAALMPVVADGPAAAAPPAPL